jgi:hypothetical protein
MDYVDQSNVSKKTLGKNRQLFPAENPDYPHGDAARALTYL